jgi:hypothetical protein
LCIEIIKKILIKIKITCVSSCFEESAPSYLVFIFNCDRFEGIREVRREVMLISTNITLAEKKNEGLPVVRVVWLAFHYTKGAGSEICVACRSYHLTSPYSESSEKSSQACVAAQK